MAENIIYQVVHLYEDDGGFGDAVEKQQIIATFADFYDATEFVKKFERIHVYDRPYAELHCGRLMVTMSDVIKRGELDLDAIDPNDFWWIANIEEEES